jgi:flagellar biosynthesis/type III secretory pathway ATPase
MKDVVETNHQAAALRFRELLSAYRDVEDMVMLGTYVRGSNPLADKAISLINELNGFLKQAFTDKTEFPDTVQRMEALCIAPPVSNAKKTDYVSSHAVRKTG